MTCTAWCQFFSLMCVFIKGMTRTQARTHTHTCMQTHWLIITCIHCDSQAQRLKQSNACHTHNILSCVYTHIHTKLMDKLLLTPSRYTHTHHTTHTHTPSTHTTSRTHTYHITHTHHTTHTHPPSTHTTSRTHTYHITHTHTHTHTPHTTYQWKRMSQQLAWSSGWCDRWRAGWRSASECWPRCSRPTRRAGGNRPPPAVGSACSLSDARGSVCSGCHRRGRLWSLSGHWPSLLGLLCPSPWCGWPVGLDPGQSGYGPGFLLKVLINQSYSQKSPGKKCSTV